jgi:hypothetical protein
MRVICRKAIAEMRSFFQPGLNGSTYLGLDILCKGTGRMWLRATCACSVNNKWPAGVVMSIENPTCDIKTVRAGVLEVAYLEFGEANGWAVILSHGFPFDVHAYECALSGHFAYQCQMASIWASLAKL